MHNTAKKTVTKMLQLLSVRILSFPAIIRLSSFKIVWGSHCGNVPAEGLFGVYRVILIPANLKINKKSHAHFTAQAWSLQAQGTGELVCFLEVYLSGNAHGIFTSEASLAKTVAVRITCTAGFKHSLGTDKCQ